MVLTHFAAVSELRKKIRFAAVSELRKKNPLSGMVLTHFAAVS